MGGLGVASHDAQPWRPAKGAGAAGADPRLCVSGCPAAARRAILGLSAGLLRRLRHGCRAEMSAALDFFLKLAPPREPGMSCF